ncbi:hypothetical protein AOLI_G00229960 [Acnodon oligacanthus]
MPLVLVKISSLLNVVSRQVGALAVGSLTGSPCSSVRRAVFSSCRGAAFKLPLTHGNFQSPRSLAVRVCFSETSGEKRTTKALNLFSPLIHCSARAVCADNHGSCF